MLAQRVNLGCGNRYHPDWINIDIAAHGLGVIAHDLSKGIPLNTASCDVVYHSAVLEHLRPNEATYFIEECFRVLKPGGVIRIAVPDLEQISRLYLQKLEAAVAGDLNSSADYDWMLLEMYDQSVRETTGGEMLEYLKQDPLPNQAFVLDRIGEEGNFLLECLRQEKMKYVSQSQIQAIKKRVRKVLYRLRNAVLFLLIGPDGPRALDIGRFRLCGEAHQWMYDRYSLARLLEQAGFRQPIQQSATQSLISDWASFYLDTSKEGAIIKPDSLFMEAVKPEAK